MPRYFGTDGIRGVPFDFPLTDQMIEKIGFAVAKTLLNKKKTAFIARDTRKSGKRILKLISKGIARCGVRIFDLGVISTPSLSYLISVKKPSFGVMISASHNPPKYNGIKVFNSEGEKVSKEVEEKIEKVIDSCRLEDEKKKVKLEKMDLSQRYIDYIVRSFKGVKSEKKVVFDCANGSTFKIAPKIFKKLNLNFTLLGVKPNGENINVGCGALETDFIGGKVVEGKYWCGISYDGDGDRCIVVDERGGVIDGDDIMMLFATYYHENRMLKDNLVVLTPMSNYGLVKYLKKKGIKIVFVDVGDRNITEAVKRYGAQVGGEASGHIVISRYLTTGDGIITSLEFLRICKKMGIEKVSDVSKMWIRYPSVLRSFEIEKKVPIEDIDGFKSFLKEEERRVDGRILVRYSGTEPVLRILVEGNADKGELEKVVERVYDFYSQKVRGLYAT